MGRSAAHVGVAEIGRAVVDVVPAGNLRAHGGRAGRKVFEAVAVGQAVEQHTASADIPFDKCTGGTGTLGSHRIVVRRVGREPGEGIAAVHKVDDRVGTQNDSETGATVGIPTDGHLVGTRSGSDIKRNVAPFVGQVDVVNAHIGSGRRARAFDGNEVTIASVIGKRHLIHHPVGCNSRVGERIDRREGAGIIGIGHHTHNGGGMVARRGGLGIECQRKVGDVVDRGVDARQHSILVAGIIRRGGKIPVHTLAAVVHIGGSGGNIGIVVVCTRGIVDTSPACGECLGISNGTIVRVIFEAVLIWQVADKRTRRAERCGIPHAGVCSTAQCGHTHRVNGVARTFADGIIGVIRYVG